MKKRIKNKILNIFVLLVFIFNFACPSLNIFAKENEKLKSNKKFEELDKKTNINVKYKNENNTEVEEKAETDVVKTEIVAESIPSKYEYGINDTTKINNYYQADLGLCWAFSSMNIFESSAQKQLNISPEIPLSRRHIDYITSKVAQDNPYKTGRDLASGSEFVMGGAYASNGAGLVYEKDFNSNKSSYTYKDLYIKNKVPYNVVGTKNFKRLVKTYANGKIKYMTDETGNKELTTTEISNIRNEIKNHIMKKGAVGTKIFAPTGKNYYSGTGKHLFIHPKHQIVVNHAVTIVGWDDSVPKEAFLDNISGLKPENDGAWIIEDTRGGGPRGLNRNDYRYYISYDSVNVEGNHLMGVDQMIHSGLNNQIYTDYSWGNNASVTFSSTGSSTNLELEIVNVYTKNTDSEERIKGIGIYVEKPTTVEIGVIPVLNINGKIIDAVNETEDIKYINSEFKIIKDGYNYINIANFGESKITAKKGQKFGIKIRLSNGSGNLTLPLDVKNMDGMNTENIKVNSGKTFIPNSSFMAKGYIDTTDGTRSKEKYKAFYGTEGENISYISNTSNEKRYACNVYTGYEDYCKVSFELDGGIGEAAPQTVAKYQKAVEPKDPYKKGYIFKGWSPDINKEIITDTVFKAIWEKVNEDIFFNIKFDYNGGNVNGNTSSEITKVKQGELPPDHVNPERSGYIFKGWEPSLKERIYKDTTFKAIWEENINEKIVIKFLLAGGNIDGQILISPKYLDKGKAYTLNIKDPVKPGYIFNGWNPDIKKPVSESTTFIAQWKSINDIPKKYIVAFDLNGGWGTHREMEVDDGTILQDIPDPQKSKYIFKGWSPDITKPIHSNIVFKANWQLKEVGFTLKYLVPLKSDLIKVIPFGAKPKDYLTDEEMNPKRDGYTFKGWDRDLNEPIEDEFNTISAIWEKEGQKEYTVRFFTNIGLEYKQIKVPVNTNITEKILKDIGIPKRDEHKFIGWNYDFSKPVENNLKIYAKWEIELKEDILIEFNLNGGKFFLSQGQKYTKKRDESFEKWIEGILTSLGRDKTEKIPTKANCRFICWIDEENNMKYPQTKELKNKYKLKAVWVDGESGIVSDNIIHEIYKPVDPEDEKSIIDPNDPNLDDIYDKQNPDNPEKPKDPKNPEDSDKDKNNENENDKDKTHNTDNKNHENENTPTKPNIDSNNYNKPRDNYNNSNGTNNNWNKKPSNSHNMTFYNPYEQKTNNINDSKIDIKNTKDKLNKKEEVKGNNPYAGLRENKIIFKFIILAVFATISFLKIKKIDKIKDRKNTNIY